MVVRGQPCDASIYPCEITIGASICPNLAINPPLINAPAAIYSVARSSSDALASRPRRKP